MLVLTHPSVFLACLQSLKADAVGDGRYTEVGFTRALASVAGVAALVFAGDTCEGPDGLPTVQAYGFNLCKALPESNSDWGCPDPSLDNLWVMYTSRQLSHFMACAPHGNVHIIMTEPNLLGVNGCIGSVVDADILDNPAYEMVPWLEVMALWNPRHLLVVGCPCVSDRQHITLAGSPERLIDKVSCALCVVLEASMIWSHVTDGW